MRRFIFVAAIAWGAAPLLDAQALALQGLAAHSTHPLVGNLLGGELLFGVPVLTDVLSLQVGAAHLAGSSARFVTTCHGFIQQENCEPEPVAGDARLTSGSLEVGLRVWHRTAATVRVTWGLRLAQVHASERGLATNRAFSGDRTWCGGGVSLEGSLAPWRRLPLALQLSGGLTRLQPVQNRFVADGYTPLDVSSTLATMRLGVVWYPKQ